MNNYKIMFNVIYVSQVMDFKRTNVLSVVKIVKYVKKILQNVRFVRKDIIILMMINNVFKIKIKIALNIMIIKNV